MTRLATYGTLRPGHPNHHHMASIAGDWIAGTVRGHLRPGGWGSALGYPGIVLDDNGPAVSVDVLDSPELDAHLSRLDEFEGLGYLRVRAAVSTAEGVVQAWIYVLAPEPGADQG